MAQSRAKFPSDFALTVSKSLPRAQARGPQPPQDGFPGIESGREWIPILPQHGATKDEPSVRTTHSPARLPGHLRRSRQRLRRRVRGGQVPLRGLRRRLHERRAQPRRVLRHRERGARHQPPPLRLVRWCGRCPDRDGQPRARGPRAGDRDAVRQRHLGGRPVGSVPGAGGAHPVLRQPARVRAPQGRRPARGRRHLPAEQAQHQLDAPYCWGCRSRIPTSSDPSWPSGQNMDPLRGPLVT